MASAEESPEPLKYQTLALKVSIHCEGCKKKVKKILQSIDGVYKTDIDTQQQKVMVTGNVEADTLIKKLIKNGKHAELLPEPKPANTNNGNSDGGKKKKNKKKKNKGAPQTVDPSDTPDKNPPVSDEEDDASSDAEADGNASKITGKESPKPNGESPKPNGSSSPPPEKEAGSATGDKSAAIPGGGGGGGKKKGKKAHKSGGGEAAVSEEVKKAAPPPAAGPPQTPAYVMSYSTSQPSYGSSAYLPVQQSSYVYSGHPPAWSYYIPTAAAAATATGEYDIFSEENANACIVM